MNRNFDQSEYLSLGTGSGDRARPISPTLLSKDAISINPNSLSFDGISKNTRTLESDEVFTVLRTLIVLLFDWL